MPGCGIVAIEFSEPANAEAWRVGWVRRVKIKCREHGDIGIFQSGNAGRGAVTAAWFKHIKDIHHIDLAVIERFLNGLPLGNIYLGRGDPNFSTAPKHNIYLNQDDGVPWIHRVYEWVPVREAMVCPAGVWHRPDPPPASIIGQLWMNSNTGEMFAMTHNGWMQVAGSGFNSEPKSETVNAASPKPAPKPEPKVPWKRKLVL